MIAGLLTASAVGCAWLCKTPRHGVCEMMAATLVLAPLMTLALLIAGVAS